MTFSLQNEAWLMLHKTASSQSMPSELKNIPSSEHDCAYSNPPAPWGHQAVKGISEPSSYRLDDLSLKTDGWYLYECCFSAPWNKPVTFPDVRCLNSGAPPSNPAPWNRPVTLPDVRCLNSGLPPDNPEISSLLPWHQKS